AAVDLYDRPINRFVAEFIGRMNLLAPALAGHDANAGHAEHDAFVGIRPEHIELIDAGTQPADMLHGRIEKCVFLRSFTRITLVVDGSSLLLELRGRRTDLEPGGTLAVRLPAGALHRLQGRAEWGIPPRARGVGGARR